MDQGLGPENVVFYNDYTTDNYANSKALAEQLKSDPAEKTRNLLPESELLASAYIINPNNIKLDGPDQYIQEHDFYENDEVLENLERQKELMLQEMYKDPAKILLLIRQMGLIFQNYPNWPESIKPKPWGDDGVQKELGIMLGKLKDIFVDIEFTTKYRREDNLQPHGPLNRSPCKAFLESTYSVVMTHETKRMVSTLVSQTKIDFGGNNHQTKSSSNNTPNNGLVASTLLMKLPQPAVHDLRVLLSTLKSDVSPLIPKLLTNQEELGHIFNIVKDREEEIARQIHERMQGERNRRKKEKRDKYLKSAQAYKSLTQNNVDIKTQENNWNHNWNKQKLESKHEETAPPSRESERMDSFRESLGKRNPGHHSTSPSTSYNYQNYGYTDLESNTQEAPFNTFINPPMSSIEERVEDNQPNEMTEFDFNNNIFNLVQQASVLETPVGFGPSKVESEDFGQGWDLPEGSSPGNPSTVVPEQTLEPTNSAENQDLSIILPENHESKCDPEVPVVMYIGESNDAEPVQLQQVSENTEPSNLLADTSNPQDPTEPAAPQLPAPVSTEPHPEQAGHTEEPSPADPEANLPPQQTEQVEEPNQQPEETTQEPIMSGTDASHPEHVAEHQQPVQPFPSEPPSEATTPDTCDLTKVLECLDSN